MKSPLRILHSADWHPRDKDIEELEKCLSFLIETARNSNIDLTVLAGDIFDLMMTDKLDSKSAKVVLQNVSALADIAPVAIVIGTPSHDGLAPQLLGYARGKFDIHVSSIPEQLFMHDGAFYEHMIGNIQPDAIITFIPQPTKQYFQTSAGIKESDQEIGQAMSALFSGFGAKIADQVAPHILVYHGGISGAALPSEHVRTGMDIEVSTDQMLLASPANYDLVGVYYSGPLYATKIDEQGPNGFYIHEVDERDYLVCCGHIHQRQALIEGNHANARFIETPHKKSIRLSDDFSVSENDHRGGLTITDCLISGEGVIIPEVTGTYIRHEIKVWQDEAGLVDKNAIKDFYLRAGAIDADIRIVRVPRENIRSKKVLTVTKLRDKLVALAESRGETVPESILLKADMLENMTEEEIIKIVTGRKEEMEVAA